MEVSNTSKMAEGNSSIGAAKKDYHLVTGKWDRKSGKSEIDIRIKKGDDVAKMKLSKGILKSLKSMEVI